MTTSQIPDSLKEAYPKDVLVQYMITPFLDNFLEFLLVLMGLLLIYFGIVLAYFRYNSEAFIFLAILPIIVEVAAFATLIPYSSYLWRKLERQASKESKGEV